MFRLSAKDHDDKQVKGHSMLSQHKIFISRSFLY